MYVPKPFIKKQIVTSPGPEKVTPVPVPTETGLIWAVTGHRPEKLGGYSPYNPTKINVCVEMSKALDELKPKAIITGMALGTDQWMAELCIAKDIPFIAAIPCLEHDNRWPPHARLKYNEIMAMSSKVELVTDSKYVEGCMKKRNEWMVNNCQGLIAVYDGTDGGTGNCIRYAQKAGRPIKFITIDKTPKVSNQTLFDGLKKPSEMAPKPFMLLTPTPYISTKVIQQLEMKFAAAMGIPEEFLKPAAPQALPPKSTKVIVSGKDGELFSEETAETNPFERLVDLD